MLLLTALPVPGRSAAPFRRAKNHLFVRLAFTPKCVNRLLASGCIAERAERCLKRSVAPIRWPEGSR